jgi:uncharacterized protein
VITFGAMRILDDTEKKPWFFDRVLAKYGQPDWTFQPGYPHSTTSSSTSSNWKS